jgi:hypothetical protein
MGNCPPYPSASYAPERNKDTDRYSKKFQLYTYTVVEDYLNYRENSFRYSFWRNERTYLLVKLLRTAAFLGILQNAHFLTFIAKFSSSQMQQKEQWI